MIDLHNFPQPGRGGAQAVTIPYYTQGAGEGKSLWSSLYKEVTGREAFLKALDRK